MTIVWSHEKSVAARLWLAFIVVFAMVAVLVPHGARAEEPSGESLTSVIVREAPGAGDGPERLVASVGGTVGTSLDLIGGFEASVPPRALRPWLPRPRLLR